MAQHQCHLSIKRSFFSTQLIFLEHHGLSSFFQSVFDFLCCTVLLPPPRQAVGWVCRDKDDREIWMYRITISRGCRSDDGFSMSPALRYERRGMLSNAQRLISITTHIYSHFAHTKNESVWLNLRGNSHSTNTWVFGWKLVGLSLCGLQLFGC